MAATTALLLAILLPVPPDTASALHEVQLQGNQPALAARQRRMEELRTHHRSRAEEPPPQPSTIEQEAGGSAGLPGADAGRWDGWYERGAFHAYPYGDGDPYGLTYDEDKGDLTLDRGGLWPF